MENEPTQHEATQDELNAELASLRGQATVESEPSREIDVAARWALHYAYEAWSEHAWEFSFPDVRMHDFDRICSRMEELLPESPSTAEYDKAHAVLEARAVDDPFAGIGDNDE